MILMLLCSGGWLLLGVVSLGFIITAPMMFDSPSARHDPAIKRAFYALLSFPVMVVVSLIGAWVWFLAGNRDSAFYILLLPLANIIIFWQGFSAASRR